MLVAYDKIKPGYLAVRGFRTWSSLFFLILLSLVSAPPANTAEQNLHALRSAYLFYFSSLIEWPSSTLFESNRLVLCVLTEDENDYFQLNTIDKRNTGKYLLDIRPISDIQEPAEPLDTCHMLYVGSSLARGVGVGVAPSTLLVTEGDVLNKGEIHLYTRNNRLMFEINLPSLIKRSFKANSKLLRLSRKE